MLRLVNAFHWDFQLLLMRIQQVAETISRATGRDIECVELSETDFKRQLMKEGVTEWMAEYLAQLDMQVAEGRGRGDVTDNVLQVAGRSPRTLEEFVEENKEVWL